MKLRIELDDGTLDALARSAEQERRPADWQAEVLLRRALGLPDVPAEVADREAGHAA